MRHKRKPDNSRANAKRRLLWRVLSRVWMWGFLPAVMLLLLAAASTMFRLHWQLDNGPPHRRCSIGDGGVIYCWDTRSRWAYTSRPRISLGLGITKNGQPLNPFVDLHSWPPDFEQAARPLALVAGNVQVSLFYLPVIAALPAAIFALIRKRRQAWMCPACRYDLRGLPQDSACPECGSTRPPGNP